MDVDKLNVGYHGNTLTEQRTHSSEYHPWIKAPCKVVSIHSLYRTPISLLAVE